MSQMTSADAVKKSVLQFINALKWDKWRVSKRRAAPVDTGEGGLARCGLDTVVALSLGERGGI